MGAIAIITTVLVFLLGIGLFGLIISTIFFILAVLKKKTKIFVVLPIVGIILFLIPFVISIMGISYFRNMIKEDDSPIFDTGIKLYWEYEKNSEDDDRYFIYDKKKYICLTSYVGDRPNGVEIDKPVANIIETEKNILAKIFMSMFGIKNKESILYTIKNYPDDSLLIVDDHYGNIFCEENRYFEINNYYDNIDNYKYYATNGHLPDETKSVELYDKEIIKEIYTYLGSGDLIQRPPEKECTYIFIFSISNDGILLKDIASIIIYSNQLYKEFGYFTEEEVKGMAILDKRQSVYINKIILDNGWENSK